MDIGTQEWWDDLYGDDDYHCTKKTKDEELIEQMVSCFTNQTKEEYDWTDSNPF